ncbi:DUF6214 family protein [Streptomyces sp. NBC_00820]|nr:DUF6214 family protein [Streptomyces sp. NBC_00820]
MSVWPAWEVTERGCVTSWFHVRLAFPDGARVDALAVVAGGRVSIEDVRARPALSLADLTVLADWIEEPLFEACGAAVEGSREGGDEGGRTDPPGGADPEWAAYAWYGQCGPYRQYVEDVAGAEDAEDAWGMTHVRGAEGVEDEHVEDVDGVEDVEDVEGVEGVAVAGARRARPAWPRGIEGCRLASQEYRAAQEEGFDPVLAVMCATGHSRRRSLKLIAQARDAGFLTPRHMRR